MIRQHDHSNGIVELVIDAPPVNAIDLTTLAELTKQIASSADDPGASVLLIRSEGSGFCAGGDVKEIQALAGFEGVLGQVEGSLELTLAIVESHLPVVVAVHGYCVGLGVLLAASADVVICAEGATFTLAEVDNGATTGVVQALGLMPDKVMRAAMLAGSPVEAELLHRTGHVYQVVPVEGLAASALEFAQTVAAKNPAVLRALKRTIRGSATPDVRALYRQEMSHTYALNMSGAAAAARNAHFPN